MKASAVISILAAGLAVAMPSLPQKTRSIGDVLPGLQRDPSGEGFTHVGSDNVVRTFDKDFNVIDFAQLDDRAPGVGGWPGHPNNAVLAEAKEAKARSEAQISKPRSRSPLEDREEKSCVSEFCPNDNYCKSLSVYGYDCSSCMIVSNNMGNCQKF
ncbi:hypothetical protein AAE478_004217 [Parahypoxylon ruwenzoriense]